MTLIVSFNSFALPLTYIAIQECHDLPTGTGFIRTKRRGTSAICDLGGLMINCPKNSCCVILSRFYINEWVFCPSGIWLPFSSPEERDYVRTSTVRVWREMTRICSVCDTFFIRPKDRFVVIVVRLYILKWINCALRLWAAFGTPKESNNLCACACSIRAKRSSTRACRNLRIVIKCPVNRFVIEVFLTLHIIKLGSWLNMQCSKDCHNNYSFTINHLNITFRLFFRNYSK